MSGDSDSSQRPTAKWLTQDRRGDGGRMVEEGEKAEKQKNKTCEISRVSVSVTNQNDSHWVYLSMCINIFVFKR